MLFLSEMLPFQRKTGEDIIINVPIGLHVKYALFLSDIVQVFENPQK